MIGYRTKCNGVDGDATDPQRGAAGTAHHPAIETFPAPMPVSAAGGGRGGNGRGHEPPPANGKDGGGDLIYGARGIADYLFPSERDREKARRRVFRIADHYRKRKEPAGFLKLNGAICLSKSQWRKFHGLD